MTNSLVQHDMNQGMVDGKDLEEESSSSWSDPSSESHAETAEKRLEEKEWCKRRVKHKETWLHFVVVCSALIRLSLSS